MIDAAVPIVLAVRPRAEVPAGNVEPTGLLFLHIKISILQYKLHDFAIENHHF